MKLYGSLTNRLEERMKSCDEIKVGMYATEYLWSDVHAWEVIEVINQNRITIRRLKAIRTDNNGAYSECQEYRFESDPKGWVYKLKRTPKGKWNHIHTEIDENGKEHITWKEPISIRFGVADEYYDYSF